MTIIENAARAAGITEEQAKAVITSIRTPTQRQMDAGLYQASHDAEFVHVYQGYVDMIDIILNGH